jgi:hypothetical protein
LADSSRIEKVVIGANKRIFLASTHYLGGSLFFSCGTSTGELKPSDLVPGYSEDDGFAPAYILQERCYDNCQTIDLINESTSGITVYNRTTIWTKNLHGAWYKKQGGPFVRLTEPHIIVQGYPTTLYIPQMEEVYLAVSTSVDMLKQYFIDNKNVVTFPLKKSKNGYKELVIKGTRDAEITIEEQQNSCELINATNHDLFYVLCSSEGEDKEDKIKWIDHQLHRRTCTRFSIQDSKKLMTLYISKDRLLTKTDRADKKRVVAQTSYNLPGNGRIPSRLIIGLNPKNDSTEFSVSDMNKNLLSVLPLIVAKSRAHGQQPLISSLAQSERVPSELPAMDEQVVVKQKIGCLPDEQEYCALRKKKVWNAVAEFLGLEHLHAIARESGMNGDKEHLVDLLKAQYEPPSIGLALAGEGYQSLIDSVGFLSAAGTKKILPLCTYVTGRSGSALAITSYVASGIVEAQEFASQWGNNIISEEKTEPDESIVAFMSRLVNDKAYIRKCAEQALFEQSQGIIGFFGHALAHKLLRGCSIDGRSAHDLTFSDLTRHMANGGYPLPICTFVGFNEEDPSGPVQHFEATPLNVTHYIHAVNSRLSSNSIKMKSFGSLYKNGKLMSPRPEYPLAQFYGIWNFEAAFLHSPQDLQEGGSVYTALMKWLPMNAATSRTDETHYHEEIDHVEKIKGLTTKGNEYIDKIFDTQHESISLGKMPNFLYASQTSNSNHAKVSATKTLLFGDSHFGNRCCQTNAFATVPLLARRVDLVIMFDSTKAGKVGTFEQLYAVKSEADTEQVLFPQIGEDILSSNSHAVMLCETDEHPIVVYLKETTKQDGEVRREDLLRSGFGCSEAKYKVFMDEAATILSDEPLDVAKKGVEATVRRILNKKKMSGQHSQLYERALCSGWSPLHVACYIGDLSEVKLLMSRGLDVNATTNTKKTPLMIACERGHLDICKILLHAQEIDIHCKDTIVGTALAWAEEFEHQEIINLLREIDRMR